MARVFGLCLPLLLRPVSALCAQNEVLPDPIRSVLSSAMPRADEMPGFKVVQHYSWAYLTPENVPKAVLRLSADSQRLRLSIWVDEYPSAEEAKKALAAWSTTSPLGLPSGSFSGRTIGDAARHTPHQEVTPGSTTLFVQTGRRTVRLILGSVRDRDVLIDSDRPMLEKLALSICERLRPLHHAEKASPSEYRRPAKQNRKP